MISDSPPVERVDGRHGYLPTITLPAHPLARHVRSRFAVLGGVVRWAVPRTVLGVAPVGVQQVAVPIDEVADIRVGNRVRPMALGAGVALIVAPVLAGLGWLALPLALVGTWVALVSFSGSIALMSTDGQTHRAPVCFGHRLDAELYAEAVAALAAEARGTSRVDAPPAEHRTAPT